MKLTIALGSDHAGFLHKEAIKSHLISCGHDVRDFGTHSADSCDYPDFIRPAAQAVASGVCSHGIVFGGSGNGEAIASNKISGIRCAVVWSEDTARWAKGHNNANMIAIGERTITSAEAIRLVDVWLSSSFEGGRHLRRIEKLEPSP